MNDAPVLYAARDGVAVITLNRPEQYNPLDRLTVSDLLDAVRMLERDSEIGIVVLRGAGQAFSAGGDLDGYLQLYRDPPEFMNFLRNLNDLAETIERSGHCVAGGVELMLSCDIVIAANEARISDGHLNFGQLPGAGGSQRLARTVGPLYAKLMILTGRGITGAEAERKGLVSLAVPADDIETSVAQLIGELQQKSALGLRGAKYLVNTGVLGVRDPAIELELRYVHNYATTSHDAYEGLLAFKEKRKPEMRGN